MLLRPADRLMDSLARRLDLEPGERALFVWMGLLVAVLFGAYTLAKVMRDALFLAHFGALALPYGYVAVAVASAGYVTLEARLTRRMSRVGSTTFTQVFAIACSALAAFAFPFARRVVAGLFFLWTGAQAMMLLSHFWVIALDVWDTRRARRLFPLFTGFGLAGGMVTGALAAWAGKTLGRDVLLWTITGLLMVAYVLTRRVNARRVTRPAIEYVPPATSRWRVLAASPFLRFLTASLALSVIVSTLVDFQFKYLLQRAYPNPWTLTQVLGVFYGGLNALALIAQFGVAGRVLRQLGLGPTAELQPISVFAFAIWMVSAPSRWLAMTMRWIQGVIFQTVGKSSAEIYYMAVRPPERRHVKPALDTLVERWSDAIVGILLAIGLHLVGVSLRGIAAATAGFAVVWFVVLRRLNHHYVRAFQTVLTSRWGDPAMVAQSLHLPAARRALTDALRSEDEPQILLALSLCRASRDHGVVEAVWRALEHPSPAVRAAAVRTLEAMRARDTQGRIAEFLAETDEDLRRATLSYLVEMGERPAAFAALVLDGPERSLRPLMVDALLEHPGRAARAVSPAWIDAQIEGGDPADVALAARALALVDARIAAPRLAALVRHSDVDVRRHALVAAAWRPAAALLSDLLPLLHDPVLAADARRAIAAIGDPAVPTLERLLDGSQGERARALAAHALARIGTRRSVDALLRLARSADPAIREIGLRNLMRIRLAWGRPVVARGLAHKLFLRELRDYRTNRTPALRLSRDARAEVRLLGDSYRELTEVALTRAMLALGTWYLPAPLRAAGTGLAAANRSASAPAIEYLHHVLPRRVFGVVDRLFEERAHEAAIEEPPTPDENAAAVRDAWTSGDPWLRATALRAARASKAVDLAALVGEPGAAAAEHPLVAAELEALGWPDPAVPVAGRGAAC